MRQNVNIALIMICDQNNVDYDSLSPGRKLQLSRSNSPEGLIDDIIIDYLSNRCIEINPDLLSYIQPESKKDYTESYKCFPNKEAFESMDFEYFITNPRTTFLVYLNDYIAILRRLRLGENYLPEDITDFFWNPEYRPRLLSVCREYYSVVKAFTKLNNQELTDEERIDLINNPGRALQILNQRNISKPNVRKTYIIRRRGENPEEFYSEIPF